MLLGKSTFYEVLNQKLYNFYLQLFLALKMLIEYVLKVEILQEIHILKLLIPLFLLNIF